MSGWFTSVLRCWPTTPTSGDRSPTFSSRRAAATKSSKVTGALLATDHNFSQVLEGERDAVEATYERIARDPRHKDIVLILYELIEVRRFPDWTMAWIGPSQSAEEAVARVTSKLPACKTGQAARALVTS